MFGIDGPMPVLPVTFLEPTAAGYYAWDSTGLVEVGWLDSRRWVWIWDGLVVTSWVAIALVT